MGCCCSVENVASQSGVPTTDFSPGGVVGAGGCVGGWASMGPVAFLMTGLSSQLGSDDSCGASAGAGVSAAFDGGNQSGVLGLAAGCLPLLTIVSSAELDGLSQSGRLDVASGTTESTQSVSRIAV